MNNPRPIRRTNPLGVAAAVVLATMAILVSACSGDSSSASSTTSATHDTSGDAAVTPVDERIVVIGEEYLLADLLALGVVPIASTATVAEAGFQGLDDYEVADIKALPATERNIEMLASLEPDRIIILDFFAEEIGLDVLESMAEVTVVPDGTGPAELVTMYGAMFGREARAAELVAEYEAAQAVAAEEFAGRPVSVATIYAGPSVAAFVDGPWAVPAELLAAGATLVPDAAAAAPDRNGRAFLSMERLDLLSAPQMLLLTTPLVEGEQQAIAEVTATPMWAALPSVRADAVETLDRLGYPGIEGRIRLIDDLVAALGPAS